MCNIMDLLIVHEVTELYFRRKIKREISSDVNKERVMELKNSIPEGLLEDSDANGFKFGRLVRKLLKMPCYAKTSDAEKREALVEVLIHGHSYKDVIEKFGIKDRTLRRYLEQISHDLNKQNVSAVKTFARASDINRALVMHQVALFQFRNAGRTSYMDQTEIDCLFSYANQAAIHGSGFSRGQIAVSIQQPL
jgi:transposase-like protein